MFLGVISLPDTSPTAKELLGDSKHLERLCDFDSLVQNDVARIAASSSAALDLAETFPGLLFAFATQYASVRQTEEALVRLENGEPLKNVATAMGLPMWLRRLPAQCFINPLVQFPDDPEFHKRMAALVPSSSETAQTWFRGLSIALDVCHPSFALWAACWLTKQHQTLGLPGNEEQFFMLASWAWHADQKKTIGHRLLRRMWTPQISLKRAMEEVAIWRQRMVLATLLDAEAEDLWLRAGTALNYEFIPLQSADEFVIESEIMSNCLDQYADRFTRNFSRIFAIRKNGRSVANVEIGLDGQDGRMPTILQIRGPRNRRVPGELWRAVYQWLGSQTLRPRTVGSTRLDPVKLQSSTFKVWQPFLTRLRSSQNERSFIAILTTNKIRGRRLAARARSRRCANRPIRFAAEPGQKQQDQSLRLQDQ